MRNENNMPVIPYVKKQGLFEAKVIAAHCVHVDIGEIRTLKNHGAGVTSQSLVKSQTGLGLRARHENARSGTQRGHRHGRSCLQ